MNRINREKFKGLDTFLPEVAFRAAEEQAGRKLEKTVPIGQLKQVRLGGENQAQASHSSAPDRAPEVGMVLGRCRLTQVLGRGASAVVYKGVHQTLEIPVAIKILLLKKNSDSEKIKKQFCLEAQTLAKLNHPYIVRILDYDRDPYPYIVLEYIDGDSLDGLIKKYGKLHWRTVAYYIYRAAVALIVAHQHGIVHRDIKPANILVTTDGRAKLTDLGVAYCATNLDLPANPMKPKSFKGTPAYVAPEQVFEPNSGDPRSDIYSLGATFYHAITGQYPFPSTSFYSAVMSHVSEPLVPPNQLADVPRELSEFIETMMAKDAGKRFQSVEEMLPSLISFFSTDDQIAADGSLVCDAVEPIQALTGTITTILIRAASNSKANS